MTRVLSALHRLSLRQLLPGLGLLVLLVGWLLWQELRPLPPWTSSELATLRSLQLAALRPLPPDPSNRVADVPAAAEFGQRLFFDPRLSRSGTFSCSSCHRPELRFTDGLTRSRALGRSQRNAPGVAGLAWSPWLYRDGRKDSLWSQALSPLEDPAEQGSNRLQLAQLVAGDADYRARYEALFGPLPPLAQRERFPDAAGPIPSRPQWQAAWQAMAEADRVAVNRVFANLGKALAAYERRLLPAPSRFDAYVAALAADPGVAEALLDRNERAGLRLFIGKAHCIDCHNGPLFTNNEFHNTGVPPWSGEPVDAGRSAALAQLRDDMFNCLGPYSDAGAGDCGELRHLREGEALLGAFRTPSLRELDGSAPYMHKGQFATLREVIDHYNRAPLAQLGHNEAKPLGLTRRERRQLEAFLQTLQAPLAAAPDLLAPPRL